MRDEQEQGLWVDCPGWQSSEVSRKRVEALIPGEEGEADELPKISYLYYHVLEHALVSCAISKFAFREPFVVSHTVGLPWHRLLWTFL
jgi:hypothetical protein